ncbi:Lnb N-terminal periplasmic domain-containing protein [Cellulophaga omnivescoria]|uniref:Lnb N-terminal periplasmic domain-containing protein n=1 Tax=Cellulophaga omnivescoria TaxID=1888890 RepID=UPI0022F07286|nr:DUF4105 domain-containing protein [Cellulophaga omnivescoria]WBU89453.1 DUF4105 domain-containing protein [Cellulophaga omnivescoria]WKB81476.1 DUF4105 domain-containing protein [Cellulophaga lytica]
MYSQNSAISNNAQISVLTCGSGDQLYSTFGHSAIRVWDPLTRTDKVYNYGIFDFNAPNFYLNFVKGKLLFKVNKQDFSRFLYEYQYEKRWVKEQVLNLNTKQKQQLYNYLEKNVKPENRDYLYDYLYNNCATKIIEVLNTSIGKDITFKENHIEKNFTFRELLDQKLSTNTWASFGIDLALGSKIDKKATVLQHTFLPDYVWSQLNNSTIKNAPLVLSNRTILKEHKKVTSINFLATPMFWSFLFLIFVLFITYTDYKNQLWSRWIDIFLLFTTGIVGFILSLLWFATDHTATANNFNLLWALPFNLVALFLLPKKKNNNTKLHKYSIILLVFLLAVPIVQIIGIQKFHPVFIPILLSLATRYVFIWQKTK